MTLLKNHSVCVALINSIQISDKITRMTELESGDANEPQQAHLYSLGPAEGISNISFIVYHEKSTWLQYDSKPQSIESKCNIPNYKKRAVAAVLHVFTHS